jgi:hypothetical protein
LGSPNLYYLVSKILKELTEIKEAITPVTASHIKFYVKVDGHYERKVHMILKVTQKVPVTLAITDVKGNPALIDGMPKWALTDESLATLVASEDGMSAVLTPVGPFGALKIQVSADADLGEGVTAILGELEVDLIAGDAAVVSLAAGTPA